MMKKLDRIAQMRQMERRKPLAILQTERNLKSLRGAGVITGAETTGRDLRRRDNANRK